MARQKQQESVVGSLDNLRQRAEKTYGSNVFHKASEMQSWKHIPTNIFTLDMALLGGIPRSLVTLIFGYAGCLDKDTFIRYHTIREDGKLANSKGGTIEDLWYKFNSKKRDGRGNYQRKQTIGASFTAPCMDDDGIIFHNTITDVIYSGEKECFKIITKNNYQIICTKDHKFFNGEKYIKLGNLFPGEEIAIHDNNHVKFSGDLEGLKFLSREQVVHHKDENFLNDAIENLEVIDTKEHSRLHLNERRKGYEVFYDKIIDICYIGNRETYDICMENPYNNFVANRFVVHNSGKTTLSLKLIAQAQKMFPEKEAAFIDIEGRMDKDWAAKNGVDLDRLWQVQPDTGEQALDLAEELIRIPDISLIVVDSLAALMPYKESQVSTEDDLPGLQPRLIGKFCRKTGSTLQAMRKYEHYPAMIWLNQWRSKITMFGDPRVLPGGIAQHNFASVKIEMLCKEVEGKDDLDINTVESNEHSFKIIKNSYGVGIRHGEFNMIRNPSSPLGQGFIDDGKTVCTYARKFGIITGGGSGGFAVEGVEQKFKILDDIVEYLYQNKEFFEALKHKLICLYRVNNGLEGEGWL